MRGTGASDPVRRSVGSTPGAEESAKCNTDFLPQGPPLFTLNNGQVDSGEDHTIIWDKYFYFPDIE